MTYRNMGSMNSIDIFPWNENFNTGFPKIDEQHQHLVQLLNLLASHVAFQSDLPALNVIFDELVDYTVYHFQTEENIWNQYLLQDLLESQHKATHHRFVETVLKLKDQQATMPVNVVLENVLAFLTRWLAAHILESDRHMAMVALAVQSGLSLDAAKQHASEKMSGSTRVLIDIILSIYESLSTNTLHLMRELAEHKRDEEFLQKLLLAVEQSPSLIVITDLNANIEFVNEAFLRTTGFNRSEVIGQNPKILHSGKNPKQLYESLWETLTQGNTWKGEFVNKRKDGSEYIESALISPVRQTDGTVTHYLGIKEDITERKNLERHLLDQLAFTQAIIQAEVDGIAVCHAIDEAPYVRFTVWNASMQTLTGYSLDEINRLGWYQTLYRAPEVQEHAKQRMRQGDHLQGEEWTITCKDSQQRTVQIHTTYCAHDGEGWHVLGVFHDITERKRAENALRDSHQQMHSLLNSMAEGAYGVDIQGNCTFVNRSFLRILGYESDDEIIGKHIHALIHHSHADGSHYPAAECKMYRAYLANEETHATDEVFWRKDGVAIPVEYWSQPLIADGVLTGAVATFIDISERKKAEAAAQQASQYTRSLIEASLDPLVTISTTGKITDVNTATEQVTGRMRSQLIGSDFATYFTDPEKARAGYKQAFTQGFVTDYPLAIRHTSGRVADVLYNASVYRDNKGNVQGVFAAARDITKRKQIETKLAKSEAHLRAIIECEPECIKVVDSKGYITHMNPAGLAMLEADCVEQVIGQPVLGMLAPEYRQAYAELFRRVLAGESQQLEYEVIGFKGGRRWLETHAVPMKDTDGQMVELAVTRDINERKQAEHQLRIAATVFESQQGMMVTDAHNNILRVNKAFTEITGYSLSEVIGKKPQILQSNRQSQHFYAKMWRNINTIGAWEGEIWNRRKNGEDYPSYLTIKAVIDPEGKTTHYVGTLADITLRKAAAAEIEHLAYYDPLTDLPNRRLLMDRLKPALAASKRTNRYGSLLFIDLDNFKTLNDSLGHDMGDLLLQQVAGRLQSCVREYDTVARLGGDEFVVMLVDLSDEPYVAAEQTETIGNKILALINQPFSLASHEYISTPSIGATLFKGQEQAAEELLKHADIAMYQAKTLGRNNLRFFDPQMQEAVITKAALQNELHKALAQHQFRLYFQIQVATPPHPFGVEVLLRWLHPTRGLVAAADFLPLAEESGIILAIEHWVLETTCAQIQAWQQDPMTSGLVVSINISAKQFFQADFVAQVQTAIQRYAINPSLLKLELTESILMKDIEDTYTIMEALSKIGVQFSLDDFGTGYSSLQYLKKLPLTQLKIDPSFIRDIAKDSNDQAIVRTIIAIATNLNLSVIAKGVETLAQRQFLSDNECSLYQGYLFSKPVPIEQFTDELKHIRGALNRS
ncbi:MAG: bacteriohemerythrin [Methylovulum sp.]|nr:bacteriohemerythrin [Methylovulum sp.]